MKTISDKRKKQSGFNHYHWGILRTSLLLTFLVGTLLIMAVKVAASDEESGWAWRQLAQETEGYWLLVETIEDPLRDEQKRVDTIRSDVVCATETNTLSEGSYTHQKEWYQSESFFPCEHNKFSNFAAVATWGRPPERITPGTTLSLEADVITTVNDPGHWGSSLTLSIYTDAPHTTCGYLTAGAKVVCGLTVSSHQPDKKEDCDLEVGAGRSAGEQFALRYCIGGSGYRYVYEWVAADEKPIGPGPGASGGSRLGTVAVVGGLTAVAVVGGVAVLGGVVAVGVVGVKALGGGGGAAAASATAGGPNVGVEMSDQVVADVVESLKEGLELSNKPPEITREQLETEIQKELDRLAEEGHFIGNKTHIQKVFNLLAPVYIYDWLRGSTNNYCGEMAEKGNAHLKKILPKGTIIEDISMDHNGFYNHIANKVILPDGTELIVDYWEGLQNKKPAIYTVDEWLKKWQRILGKKRENTHHPFPTIGPSYEQEVTPRYTKYNDNKLISEGQIKVIEFILENGTQDTTDLLTKIRPPEQQEFQHFTTNSVLPEQLEALKNWGKTLDEEAIATHVDYILNSKKPNERRIWKEVNLTRRGIKGTKSWHFN